MKRKKIGLALGSGSTRGFAHIGVLKVLIEEGIPIDYLVGSSAGAIVAGYYAVHGEIEGLEKLMLTMKKVEFATLVDLTTPKNALIRGKKMHRFLEKMYLKSEFSNTKIKLQVNATDLRKGREIDLVSGNIAEAVMASAAFPGIFPPIKKDKQLLVDGGVINPTPVDVVRKMGADIILGVDLTMKGNISMADPNIMEIIMRSFDVLRTETTKMTAKKVGKNLVIIKPKINPNYGFLRCFANKREVIACGEEAARSSIPKIKKLLEGN